MATSMNISLPEALKRFARERAEQAGFANPSDYVRDLIRADRKRAEKERLDRMLMEGLASGDPQLLDSKEWDDIRSEIMVKAAKNKTAKA